MLITASDAMTFQFLLNHALNLASKGWHVDVASFAASRYEGQNYFERICTALPSDSRFFRLSSDRSPLCPRNFKGLKELKKIVADGNYDIVWTNEPVNGVLTRLACRKARKHGTKVMYVAHGFHFYKGAPIMNRILFYPAEKLMSYSTDLLVTINRDDFETARKKLKAARTEYIHGIGFDEKRFSSETGNRDAVRKELGVPKDAFMLLSVGELNENKNHRVVVEALSKLKEKDIYYVVCGSGETGETLLRIARSGGFEDRVILPGFREDIAAVCNAADVYCFPSLREGLGVSLLEAMSVGLPAVCSDVRGIWDLISSDGGRRCDPTDPEAFARAIEELYSNRDLCLALGRRNKAFVSEFGFENVKKEIERLVESL